MQRKLIPAIIILMSLPFSSFDRIVAAQESNSPEKLVASWSFEKDNNGWAAQNQCEIKARDGSLHVKSTGRDPFSGTRVKAPAGWLKLTIKAKFRGTLNSQLFWTTEAENDTSESKSVRFKLLSRGKGWSVANVHFNTKSPLTGLRFDPHSAPMEMQIERFELRASGPPPEDPATDPAGFKTLPGFKVELLYSVPKRTQGSWVSMTVDPKGRLIVCDQYGGLYRVTPKPLGQAGATNIEPLKIEIGEAQGLLYEFNSLYVMVNRGGKFKTGLYRIKDTDGDDQFDKVEKLQELAGPAGEHGPHGIVKSPDGKSLYVIAGNNTYLPEDIKTYLLPKTWAEDQLLPRAPCSNGHNTGRMAPGGFVCRIDPDGKNWDLIAAGFRNPYDLAFNRDGELFTYDADMEMDVGTPWYRPTRVCHVVSGGEFGWRYGTGKWPAYSPDSLPAVANIGQGSPTGVTFGYGTNFPHRYADALYVCDWTYGRLYAVHLEEAGASYTGKLEEFITGTPMPLTDIVVNPHDKAMYFTIGGRRTQSGLYRVTFNRKISANATTAKSKEAAKLRQLRRSLEVQHSFLQPRAVNMPWHYLSHEDRHIRYAARIAVEHVNVDVWREKALKETQPDRAIQSLLALARSGVESDGPKIIAALRRISAKKLTARQRTDLLRAVGVTFARHGGPADEVRKQFASELASHFPADDEALNQELCRVLVYLNSGAALSPSLARMAAAETQEALLGYAMSLRVAQTGWNPNLRRSYLGLLNKAESAAGLGNYVGGGHLQIYVRRMRDDAVKLIDENKRADYDDVLKAKLVSAIPTGSPTPRKFIRNWKQEDILPELDRVGSGRSFAVGKQMFQIASCVQCHRFNNIGGILGPDITAASKRYSRAIMVREILDPSKQISDQFRTHAIRTIEGKTYEGRVLDKNEKQLTVALDPRSPQSVVEIPMDDVDEMVPSKVSLMPKDLLNTLSKEEILDLLAYIESAGNPEHPNFKE
ncbi:MAG: heme-binding protein [Planctomycetaceae bacterium]|nr:heme-binding protein [Planctomycetaceae bacterium]